MWYTKRMLPISIFIFMWNNIVYPKKTEIPRQQSAYSMCPEEACKAEIFSKKDYDMHDLENKSTANSLKNEQVAINKRRALITGITGQDGAYLAEFLLEMGYAEVHGIKRRSSIFNTERLNHLVDFPPMLDKSIKKYPGKFFLHFGDLTDSTNIVALISKIKPHEVYNLGAQSHVQVSFTIPEYTAMVDALGALRVLEALRILEMEHVKFYQASSSEMFGKVMEIPQRETTPFYPRSPYAVSKVFAYWITVNYRESYNMFAVNGILFNHESPLRGETFVTRKITRAVAMIFHGLQDVLYLGNLDAKRDWGYAKEYVRAMWMMLQHSEPNDWVVATGETHSVREFVELAFARVGMPIEWRGEGLEEKGYDKTTGKLLVAVDERYFRPAEVDILIGDPTKIKTQLGWQPETTFKELVEIMVDADMQGIRTMIKPRIHEDAADMFSSPVQSKSSLTQKGY